MKPQHLLLFLLASLGSFILLGWAFPEGLKVGNLNLKFFHVPQNEISVAAPQPEKKINQAELLKLQKNAEKLVEADSVISTPDGSIVEKESEEIEPAAAFHIDSSMALQFPAGDSTILQPFFRSLDSAKAKGELIRILHIGDSQIEGDRISGYIRQRLQQRFGGCGPGLVPFSEPEPSRLYLRMSGFENTEKFQLLGKGKKGNHNRYSLFHNYFHLKPDSSGSLSRGNFSYRLNRQGYKRNAYFESALLMTRNQNTPLLVQSSSGSKRYQPSDSLRFSSWKLPKAATEFSFSLSTGTSTDLFGICLDCKSGVAVDNIPLRGSSGLELLKIKPSFLQEQIRRLNTKLIILQFGVNVVPYEAASYTWYENTLVRIIQTMKKSAPGIQVLVIGVSDMARKKDGQWSSFETIPRVIQAQKRACARSNSAFWDMHQVMGGKNSILAWSKTNPPLAGKDMIHLTPKGAQVAGEFLFQAIQSQMGHDQRSSTRKEN
jgi:lysophospholipase L1-like esterase